MKWYLVSTALVLIILTIYLNRSYAYFFHNIGQKNLPDPNVMTKYVLSSPKAKIPKNIVYAALGDSLAAGVGTNDFRSSYPYLISQNLNREFSQVTLFDYGFPGAKVSQVGDTQIAKIINLYPEYVTITVGINDVLDDHTQTEFQNDYSKMLEKISTLKNAKIYIINIPYLGSQKSLLPPYNYLLDLRIRQFNQIIFALVKKYPFYYIDLYSQLKSVQSDPKYYSVDGFHPSEWGYLQWGEILNASISR